MAGGEIRMADTHPDYVAPLPAAEIQRRAISGSSWTVLQVLVSLPVAFVANAVVARSLGVTSYGHLAFLTAALALAYTLANLGFSNAVTQEGSKLEAAGRRAAAADLLRRSLGFHAVVELPILLAVALALTRDDPLWEVVALAVAVLASCLLSGASLSLTIENRTAAAARVAIGVNLALQAATVTTAVLTSSASAVWVVRALVPALALAVNFFLLDRQRRAAALRPRLPTMLGRSFWRYSLFTWASGLVALLVYSRSEIFLLELFDKREALGLFALAFGLSQMITAPADAMLHALLPAVSGLLSAWPERALRAFERSTRVSVLLCGFVAAFVIPVLVFTIPLIYGRSFVSAAWLFMPLAFVSTFQSVNNPVVAFVNARQRGGLILKASAAGLLVDVAVAVALIPPFGAWGAVAANVFGQLVVLVWLAATEPLAMTHGPRGLLRLYRPFLFGSAIGGASLVVGAVVQASSTALAAASTCALGGGLYLLAVRITRTGLTIQDRDALVGAMAKPIQPYLSRLLGPVTTPSVA
jgi:O-antigen/teichoic acid export membrane protein